jgi:3-hydroxybutyryl-CoA dehydrogenase
MPHTNTVNRHPSSVNAHRIAICASDQQKSELLRSPLFQSYELLFAAYPEQLAGLHADAYFDLLFETDENPAALNSERVAILSRLLPSPVFINSVIQPLSAIHPGFIRINGWPGFLEMPLLEAAAAKDREEKARKIFGDRILFVKDIPGLVNPRIISMIIQEARITLGAGTSSAAEIDTAMQLGTGYPLGPFAWAEKIGMARVSALLEALEEDDG